MKDKLEEKIKGIIMSNAILGGVLEDTKGTDLKLLVEELSQLITTQVEEKRDSEEVIPVERVKEAFKNFVEYCEFNDLNKLVDKRDSTGNWYSLRQLVEEWVEDNMSTNTSSEKKEHAMNEYTRHIKRITKEVSRSL